MALNIEINDSFLITSDSLQIVIKRKHTIDPTKSPSFNSEKHSSEIRTEWREWKFCGSIASACDIILKQRILESEASSLRQLRDEISTFRREISDLIGE